MAKKINCMLLVGVIALLGCGSDKGSDGTGGGTGSGGAQSGGGAPASGGTTATGGSGGSGMAGMGGGGMAGAGGSLMAPVITMVMPMAPGLHVMWTNQQSDCDSVEGERKSPTADWAMVFSVPGYVDNKMDGTATDKVEYTFRLRCKKGADYSAYSNEMSGTPQ